MNRQPPAKGAVAFVDGQNLFHAAREAFGYTYPNYDVSALAEQVCAGQAWELAQLRFYTGIPDVGDNARWHFFWTHKLAAMGRQGVVVYSRPLRYRNRRGINKTDWIRIDRELYDQCLDRRDYRRKPQGS